MAKQRFLNPPWHLTDPDKLKPTPHVFLDSAEGHAIATIWDRGTAPLLLAAPDLLSCLIAYVELEESAAPYSSSPMRERSRAAIAKATGQ